MLKNQLTAVETTRRIRNAFGKEAENDEVSRFWFHPFKNVNKCTGHEQR